MDISMNQSSSKICKQVQWKSWPRVLHFLVVLGTVLGLAMPAQAALIDRGLFDDGMGGQINLIYDNDLMITWLGDANYAQTSGFDADGAMTWVDANTWAASLTIGGYIDWRLPTTAQPDVSCAGQINIVGFDPQGFGPDCTGSEMGHLSNVEGISAAAPGLFSNVSDTFAYFSATEYAIDPDDAWTYFFLSDFQVLGAKANPEYAWAVRSGDVAGIPPQVPEPSTLLLMGWYSRLAPVSSETYMAELA